MPEKEKTKKRALGRGIDTLIPNLDTLTRERDFFLCNIDSIYPNPMQPRQSFPDDSLNELAASIKEMGVILWSHQVEKAEVSVIHPSKNISLNKGYTASFAIRELSSNQGHRIDLFTKYATDRA